MPEDCFPGVVGFSAASSLGEAIKSLFDFFGKADSKHRNKRCYTNIAPAAGW